MSTLGFIGTGTIGAPMAARLLEHGHSLLVFDQAETAMAPLAAQGARIAASVAQVARECATVFLSLPGPPQIEQVVLGAQGLLDCAAALTTIVDLSTNSVSLSRRLAEAARAGGRHYVDAPVSGGKVAARDGTLAIMAGGDEAVFDAIRPLLECLGRHLFYLGPAGSGTLAKLVNNQIFLCASVLIQEGFVMGARAGMDPGALLEVLEVSSAGPLLARAPLVLSRQFDLDVFALSIAAKDVAVALESARELGVAMPMTAAAGDIYREALDRGLGAEAFFATARILEQRAGIELPSLRKHKGGGQ